jgi:RNA recognition motif-containing protein
MPPKAAPKAAAPKPAAKAPAAKPAAPAAKAAAKAAPAKAQAAAPAAKKAAAPTPVAAGNGVYIKGLTNESVAEVKTLFASAGNIADVRLRRNKFAIVFFESNAGATKAIQQFNGKAVGAANKNISVSAARAAPKKDAKAAAVTIFVSPIFRQSTSRKQVRKLFESSGKITRLRTYRKNCAFVTFETAAAAAAAVKNVAGTKFQNKNLVVKASVRKA